MHSASHYFLACMLLLAQPSAAVIFRAFCGPLSQSNVLQLLDPQPTFLTCYSLQLPLFSEKGTLPSGDIRVAPKNPLHSCEFLAQQQDEQHRNRNR